MSQRTYLRLALASVFVCLSSGIAAENARKDVADPLPPGAVLRFGTTRLRPGGATTHLAFSPDGGKIASWSSELYVINSLAIWDTRTGRLLRRVDLPGAGLSALMWLADGRGLALLHPGDGRGTLIWEFTDEKANPKIAPRMEAGGKVAIAPPGGRPVDNETDSCYAVSPDGKTLAIGRSGGQEDKRRPIWLRPLKSGVGVNTLAAPKELAQHPGNCGMLLFTPNGKRLVAFNVAKDSAATSRRISTSSSSGTWSAAKKSCASPPRVPLRTTAPRRPYQIGNSPSAWRTAQRACGT